MWRTLSAGILAGIVASLSLAAAAQTNFNHQAIAYFVPEKRVRLETQVNDPKGVKLTRAYFKAGAQADYTFVPMQSAGANRYVAILPAPSASTPSIEYLFLAQNADGAVAKTTPYTVQARKVSETPAWQSAGNQGELKVFTELPTAPATVSGFTDSVALDVVESGARLGATAGLYGAQGAGAGGATAGATGTVGGLSTAAIIGGVAVAGGLAAAASSGGGGGGGGGSSSAPVTGAWSGTQSSNFTFTCPSFPSGNGTCSVTAPFSGTVSASNVFTGSTSNTTASCTNTFLGPLAQTFVTASPLSFTLNSSNQSSLPAVNINQSGTSINCPAGNITFSGSPRSISGSQNCSGSSTQSGTTCNFTFTLSFTGS